MGAGLSDRPVGAIIAGGRATRLGGIAKGLLDIGGKRILDRVANVLAPHVTELIVVANDEQAGSWLPNARVVRDSLEGGGSAAGIHAALASARRPILAVAWDMPFLTSCVFETILAAVRPDSIAIVPATDTTMHPLCAWYAPAFAKNIERAWATNERRLQSLVSAAGAELVSAAAFAECGDVDRLFMNINTPDDLSAARSIA